MANVSSIQIDGLIAEDDFQYKSYAKVAASCLDAGFEPPKEVSEYFGGEDQVYPVSSRIRLASRYLGSSLFDDEDRPRAGIKRFTSDGCEGFEIDLAKIPYHVTKLRLFATSSEFQTIAQKTKTRTGKRKPIKTKAKARK